MAPKCDARSAMLRRWFCTSDFSRPFQEPQKTSQRSNCTFNRSAEPSGASNIPSSHFPRKKTCSGPSGMGPVPSTLSGIEGRCCRTLWWRSLPRTPRPGPGNGVIEDGSGSRHVFCIVCLLNMVVACNKQDMIRYAYAIYIIFGCCSFGGPTVINGAYSRHAESHGPA